MLDQYVRAIWFANLLSLYTSPAWCPLHGPAIAGKREMVGMIKLSTRARKDKCSARIQVVTEICSDILWELHFWLLRPRVVLWFPDTASSATRLTLMQPESLYRNCGDFGCAWSIWSCDLICQFTVLVHKPCLVPSAWTRHSWKERNGRND